MQEVQKIVKREKLVEKLTAEEEEEILRNAEAKRLNETTGARATAKAASIDAAATMKNVHQEVRALIFSKQQCVYVMMLVTNVLTADPQPSRTHRHRSFSVHDARPRP